MNEPIAFCDDITIKIDENGVCFALRSRDFKGVQGVQCEMNYALQSFGDYKETETASALKERDYKDATDLIGGDAMTSVVRRLTPLE